MSDPSDPIFAAAYWQDRALAAEAELEGNGDMTTWLSRKETDMADDPKIVAALERARQGNAGFTDAKLLAWYFTRKIDEFHKRLKALEAK